MLGFIINDPFFLWTNKTAEFARHGERGRTIVFKVPRYIPLEGATAVTLYYQHEDDDVIKLAPIYTDEAANTVNWTLTQEISEAPGECRFQIEVRKGDTVMITDMYYGTTAPSITG